MLFSNSIQRVNTIYKEYPKQFWIVVGANFIDRIGGGLIYPFFALYITKQFQVGMTEVGILFALFSISDLIGNMRLYLGSQNRDKCGIFYKGKLSNRLGYIFTFMCQQQSLKC